MQLSDAIRYRIRYYLDKHDMSLWKLYKFSGVPKSTLCALMKDNAGLPKIVTLLHICEGFNITIKEFFDDEIFENVEQD